MFLADVLKADVVHHSGSCARFPSQRLVAQYDVTVAPTVFSENVSVCLARWTVLKRPIRQRDICGGRRSLGKSIFVR